MNDERSLGDLEREYVEAKEAWEAASIQSSYANSAETSALNAVNEITKTIDRRLAEMRKEAPRMADWHREAKP